MSEVQKLSTGLDNQCIAIDDNGGWIRATSRRKKQQLKHNHPTRLPILRPSASDRSKRLMNTLDDCDWDVLVKKFNVTRSHYLDTRIGRSFVNGLLESLNQAYRLLCNDDLKFKSIQVLCLGLGNPSTDEASLRQLAVLDTLITLDERFSRSKTQIYDPLLQLCSRKLIKKLGMQVLTENKEGCYLLDPESYHFVMLPHCAPVLLNNLLFTNWNFHTIGRLVLYSNGWSEVRNELLANGETENRIVQNLGCIHALESVLTLPGKRMYLNLNNHLTEPRSFEGMRIQCFPPSKLNKLVEQVWNKASIGPINSDSTTEAKTDSTERFYSDMISKNMIPGYLDEYV